MHGLPGRAYAQAQVLGGASSNAWEAGRHLAQRRSAATARRRLHALPLLLLFGSVLYALLGPAAHPAGSRASLVQLGQAGEPPAAVPAPQPAMQTDRQARKDQQPSLPPPPAPQHHQQLDEAAETLAALKQHVAEHGPAGSFFPAGCRWREAAAGQGSAQPASNRSLSSGACVLVKPRAALFGGIESVWRCHAYEYWHPEQQAWTAEQPAACRLDALPLRELAAERAAGFSNATGGSDVPTSTWGALAMQEQAEQQAQGEQRQETAPGRAAAGTAGNASASALGLASDARCAPHYCVLRNIWYSGGHFYFLADDSSPELPGTQWQLGASRANRVLGVRSAARFAASARARTVPGETLVLDYQFKLHPGALGHWLEMLLPVFSILRREPLVRRTPHRLLLLSQQRANLCDWVRGLLTAVLGVSPGQDLPAIIFQQEVAEPLDQTAQLLEGARPGEWLLFEQLLWPKDVLSGGQRGCQDSRDAQLLRATMHAQYGLPFPSLPPAPLPNGTVPARSPSLPAATPGPAPRPAPAQQRLSARASRLRITLQHKRANRRMLNEAEVVAALREFGQVSVVEFGAHATLAEQLRVVGRTDLFISVHTSNLANALFLPPGARVVEVLQRNWGWEGIDRFFKSLTGQLGDIHHFALRAQGVNETVFPNPTLSKLFSHWEPDQCTTSDCVEALTQVDVWVDVPALKKLLASRLPLIRAGASVAEAEAPWPVLPAAPPQTGQQGRGQAANVSQLELQPVSRLFDRQPASLHG